MTFAALTHTKVGGASGGTTPAIDTTGAKLIVISTAYSGSVTISDSRSNTWTLALSRGPGPVIALYYCVNPATDAAHTFTCAGSVSSLAVQAFSATNTPAVDAGVTSQKSTSGLSHITGSSAMLPSGSGGLVVSAGSFPNAYGGTLSAGSGWTLADAQNYVSQTNYGCDLVYQIQTTATSIPAGTVTTSWSSNSFASDCVSVAFNEVVTAGLTITTPKAFEVHQRSGSTGSIQISGTVSGATEDIEASFNGGAYQTIASAVAAGNFTGTLTGQAQGQGTLTVRKKTTTSATASVANVGIGDVFVDGGDSRDEGRGTNAQPYSHATLKACMFKAGAWAELADTAGGGTIWPRFATRHMASQGVPIGIIRRGTGSTDVAGSNNSWAKPNSDYSGLVSAVTASTAASVKAALFLLGPNAIVNSNNAAIPLATYRTALDTLATNLAADLPGAPSLFVDVCGETGTGSPPDRRAAEDNIRGAILSAWTNNSTAIKGGPVLIDQDYADNVHPSTDAQLLQQADRYWLAVEAALYSGTHARGPRITAAQWNAARTQLTVTFDQALKTGLTHAAQAWIVNDVGGLGAMTINGVAYHGTNPNALVLTVSTAAIGANGSTRMTFASGDDAVGRVVPLSADIAMPGGGTVNQPAEPTYSFAVSEFAATATTVTLTLTTDGSTPAAGLTGLRWAFFDQAIPNSMAAPVAKGTGGSTNGSGVFTASISGTALAVGSTGWMVVTDSDGTVGQAGGCKGFSGPVQVS